MNDRIPLQIIEGRLVLLALVECRHLRVRKQLVEFVIDTGSPESYIGQRDSTKLQIPVKDKKNEGIVAFGGSQYKKIILPPFNFYLLKQDKQKNDYISLKVNLRALKTSKISEQKIQAADALPSILGLNFLREQKLSLHVVLTEDMAYLQIED
ncbi:hypothetical protein HYX04_05590 [Candidatus Woesearchaeota archaeon]|nr:hypothetical protein [Candidatus Woesearchaeota archaeon]